MAGGSRSRSRSPRPRCAPSQHATDAQAASKPYLNRGTHSSGRPPPLEVQHREQEGTHLFSGPRHHAHARTRRKAHRTLAKGVEQEAAQHVHATLRSFRYSARACACSNGDPCIVASGNLHTSAELNGRAMFGDDRVDADLRMRVRPFRLTGLSTQWQAGTGRTQGHRKNHERSHAARARHNAIV